MTIKQLAYSAQQRIESITGGSIKRSHVHEFLAAAFGFKSYAALISDAVFIEQLPGLRLGAADAVLVRERCIAIGYEAGLADAVAESLTAFVAERPFGVVGIVALAEYLRRDSPLWGNYANDEADGDLQTDRWHDSGDFLGCPLLLDCLESAAAGGHREAHYALALIHAGDEDDDEVEPGSDFWYLQGQAGRVLEGIEKEWADAHATRLISAQKYEHHLREASRLGQVEAQLDLADCFADPSFFENANDSVDADPAMVARVAERLGDVGKAKKWLTEAAESGDTNAMLRLIESYDSNDLQKCWTWIYLAELVGTDLTTSDFRAIHEDGSDYDDDVGGTVCVAGREGVRLEPLGAEQDAAARKAANDIFGRS